MEAFALKKKKIVFKTFQEVTQQGVTKIGEAIR